MAEARAENFIWVSKCNAANRLILVFRPERSESAAWSTERSEGEVFRLQKLFRRRMDNDLFKFTLRQYHKTITNFSKFFTGHIKECQFDGIIVRNKVFAVNSNVIKSIILIK